MSSHNSGRVGNEIIWLTAYNVQLFFNPIFQLRLFLVQNIHFATFFIIMHVIYDIPAGLVIKRY
jgi:hypothetical protein